MSLAVRRAAAWIPAVAYMALIFGLSSFRLEGVRLPRSSDKGIHFVEYAVLALLVLFALRRSAPSWSVRLAAVVAWAVASVYGATDELHQAFVPGRHSSLYDWMADALGAAVALLLVTRFGKEGHRGPDHPVVSR